MAHLGSRHHARAMTKCTSQSAAAASPTSPRATRACACRPSRREFTKFGPISDVFLPKDRNTGEMRGFGFVTFEEVRDCEDAIAEMDG